MASARVVGRVAMVAAVALTVSGLGALKAPSALADNATAKVIIENLSGEDFYLPRSWEDINDASRQSWKSNPSCGDGCGFSVGYKPPATLANGQTAVISAYGKPDDLTMDMNYWDTVGSFRYTGGLYLKMSVKRISPLEVRREVSCSGGSVWHHIRLERLWDTRNELNKEFVMKLRVVPDPVNNPAPASSPTNAG